MSIHYKRCWHYVTACTHQTLHFCVSYYWIVFNNDLLLWSCFYWRISVLGDGQTWAFHELPLHRKEKKMNKLKSPEKEKYKVSIFNLWAWTSVQRYKDLMTLQEVLCQYIALPIKSYDPVQIIHTALQKRRI